MKLLINNNQCKHEIGKQLVQLLERAALACLTYENWDINYEISLFLVNDDEIRELNKTYRNMDCPTDVLSFTLVDEGQIITPADMEEKPLGDIVISAERAALQAKKYKHSFEKEMVFLFVHSMFHLMGYDHDTEKSAKIMETKERTILFYLGLIKK